MELIAIDAARSSQIAAIGLTADANLRVQFRRGGLYEYEDVTVGEFNEILNAPRPGDVFRERIKGRKPYRRIDEAAPPAVVEAAPAPAPELVAVAPGADPKVQEVSKESSELAQQAASLAVTDAASQENASGLLLTIAAMRKKIADTWKPMKDAAFKAHRIVCEKEKELDAPLLDAERRLKNAIGAFVAEQQRLAREHEEGLRRQERERAEAEAKAEAERLALEDAVSLASEGRMDEAEAVMAHPLPVTPRYIAPAPVAPAVAQVKGVSTREVWKFRIVDEEKIPREYLSVNESAIRAVVERTKGKIRIAGIETYSEQQVAASRRA